MANACGDCPFRRDAARGWLGGAGGGIDGGYAAEHFLAWAWTLEDAEARTCHTLPAMICRGLVVTMRNGAKIPRDPEFAALVRSVEPDRWRYLEGYAEFVEFHEREPVARSTRVRRTRRDGASGASYRERTERRRVHDAYKDGYYRMGRGQENHRFGRTIYEDHANGHVVAVVRCRIGGYGMSKICWAVVAEKRDDAAPAIYYRPTRRKTAIEAAKDLLKGLEEDDADEVIAEHQKAIEDGDAS